MFLDFSKDEYILAKKINEHFPIFKFESTVYYAKASDSFYLEVVDFDETAYGCIWENAYFSNMNFECMCKFINEIMISHLEVFNKAHKFMYENTRHFIIDSSDHNHIVSEDMSINLDEHIDDLIKRFVYWIIYTIIFEYLQNRINAVNNAIKIGKEDSASILRDCCCINV